MRRKSVRDFRAHLAQLLEGTEPLLVTRHGTNLAIVYPLRDLNKVPVEVRRNIVDSVARQLAVRSNLPVQSPVLERYMRDVDRTLIRENLRRTPEERLRALQEMQRFAGEIRRAGRARRR